MKWKVLCFQKLLMVLSIICILCNYVFLLKLYDDVETQFLDMTKAFMTPPLQSSKEVVICLIQKDELNYLDEWTDYHLALGFSKIFIYDNSLDPIKMRRWRSKRDDREKLVLSFAPGERQQMLAYRDCAKKASLLNFTWVCFLDVDEFLVLKEHENVSSFLSENRDKVQIMIYWQLYGTMGRQTYQPLPVLYRFQCRVAGLHPQIGFTKAIVRLSALDTSVNFTSPHAFPLRNTTLFDVEAIYQFPTSTAVVNHYFFRSHEEYVGKRQRGDVYYGGGGKFMLLEAISGIDVYTGQPIPNGSIYDDKAWRFLVSHIPKYASLPGVTKVGTNCDQFQDDVVKRAHNFTDYATLIRAFFNISSP